MHPRIPRSDRRGGAAMLLRGSRRRAHIGATEGLDLAEPLLSCLSLGCQEVFRRNRWSRPVLGRHASKRYRRNRWSRPVLGRHASKRCRRNRWSGPVLGRHGSKRYRRNRRSGFVCYLHLRQWWVGVCSRQRSRHRRQRRLHEHPGRCGRRAVRQHIALHNQNQGRRTRSTRPPTQRSATSRRWPC